ncbi:death-associated protein-like 1 isoform X1 [Chiloscyllium punctatum]|uniref:death-associated protein-like 1 isoform X1 n=2 Tax=Chiloscyllium punctatum TaxID=137246 RepID=UPI003B63BD61
MSFHSDTGVSGVMRNQKENGSEQKTTKYILGSSSVNLSIRSFDLAKTMDKLSRKFPPEAAQQKFQPALEKIPLPRQLHTIHQPRKC